MSDGKVHTRLTSLANLWKPARNRNVLKGLLAVLLGAVLISTVIPATAQASGPRITINRINGEYVVQGWGFAPNTQGQVWAQLGSLTGQKASHINGTGYFWTTFYLFTSDHTGASQAKAWDTKGGYATASRTMGSGNTASFQGKTLVDNSTTSTTAAPAPAQEQSAAQQAPAPTTTVKPTTTTAKPTTTSAPSSTTGAPAGWSMAFDDEFNGSSVDKSKWGEYSGTGNQGIGTRSPSAISEGGGELNITGNNWVGGGMASNYSTTYGLFEVRAKFDSGSGYNIAALLWPSSEHWPQDGELDLAEMFDGVTSQVGSFDHWGSNNTQTGHTSYGSYNNWHTFAVDWESTSVTWYIDGNQVMQVTGAGVPHSNHFMGLQLDVASDNNKTNGETFHVDWVHIYKRS